MTPQHQQVMAAALLVVAAAAAAPLRRGSPPPCSLNGARGDDGACVCDPGWEGAACERLRLLPANLSQGANWLSGRGGEGTMHEFPKGGAKDIEAAIAAADAAWNASTWADMKAADRAAIVAKMAAGIAENQEMLAEIEAADVGKPFRQANMTLGGAAGEGAYWCSLGAALDAEQDKPVDSGGGVGGVPPDAWDVVCECQVIAVSRP